MAVLHKHGIRLKTLACSVALLCVCMCLYVCHVLCLLPTLPAVKGTKGLVIYVLHPHAFTVSVLCVCCLSCVCSGAGDVLADSVLSLRSVEKLFIRDINPVPLFRVLSQNAEHCSVSTLGIAFRHHPEQVRCVSLGSCSTSHPVPSPHTCTHSVCCITYTHVFSCIISHGAISQYSFGPKC